jgi:hypothetical protein
MTLMADYGCCRTCSYFALELCLLFAAYLAPSRAIDHHSSSQYYCDTRLSITSAALDVVVSALVACTRALPRSTLRCRRHVHHRRSVPPYPQALRKLYHLPAHLPAKTLSEADARHVDSIIIVATRDERHLALRLIRSPAPSRCSA